MSTSKIAAVCLVLSLWGAVVHAGTHHYYYTDPQGTVLAKADASGVIIATYDYAPYGTAVASLSPAPNGPGYTGHVSDPETGLVYMQARYYDPGVGRFLSADPMGTSASDLFGFNRYVYGNNNPISNTDPTGMQDCSDACMRMRQLSNHFTNMANGISDANASAGISAHGSGDWAHPGQNLELTESQKSMASFGAFAMGQIADAMNDLDDFTESTGRTGTPSIAATLSVATMFTPIGPEAREATIGEKIIARNVHGNSAASTVITYLYRLVDDSGNLLKWGISGAPNRRYTYGFMVEKRMNIMMSGSRREMLNLERWLIERDRGPLNRERLKRAPAGDVP